MRAAASKLMRHPHLYLLSGSTEDLAAFAYSLRHEGGTRGLEVARMAAARARREPECPADTLALALLVLGNALRIAGNLRCAARTLRAGEKARLEGSCSWELHAFSLQLRASLSINSRRLEEAEALLQQAEAVAVRGGLGLEATKARIKRAICASYRGEAAEAVRIIRDALAQGEWAPDLRRAAIEIAIVNLADTEPIEALRLHVVSRPLYDAEDCPERMRLKYRWAGGIIAARLGRLAPLQEVRAAYLARDMAYEAAMVSIDLALGAEVRGDRQLASAYVEEAIPVLAICGLGDLGRPEISSPALKALRCALSAGAIPSL